MKARYKFILLLSLLCVLQTSIAQVDPEDQGGLHVMDKSKFQNETYYSFSENDAESVHNVFSLFRYGFGKNLELQLGWNGDRVDNGGNVSSGQFSTLGVKAFLTEEGKYLPGLAAQINANVTLDRVNEGFNPTLGVLFEKSLFYTFNVNGGAYLAYHDHHSDYSFNYNVNFESSIGSNVIAYIGYTTNRFSPEPEMSKISNSYIEFGTLIWVKSGIKIYPYYDYAIEEGLDDIYNFALIFSL